MGGPLYCYVPEFPLESRPLVSSVNCIDVDACCCYVCCVWYILCTGRVVAVDLENWHEPDRSPKLCDHTVKLPTKDTLDLLPLELESPTNTSDTLQIVSVRLMVLILTFISLLLFRTRIETGRVVFHKTSSTPRSFRF
jgi:hypothetical protein